MARKAAWSAAQQSRYTDVGGIRIHDRGAGNGPPVVFVHGLAVSSRSFIPTIAAMAPWYSCRAVDLPGFGLSADPERLLDVGGLADALAGWLRATLQTEAVLVGISAGCQVVADCIARHQDVAGPVVLIGPTVDPAARNASTQVLRWLRTSVHADVTQLPMLLGDTRRAGVGRVTRTFRSMLKDRIEVNLAQIPQPALVLRGAQDPIVPQRWAEEAAALLPNGTLDVVSGGAHIINYTLPQSVGLVVRQFLTQAGWS